MTPHRSVASTSHQWNAVRSTGAPPAPFIGGEEVLDAAEPARAEFSGCAEPPRPDAEPGQVLDRLTGVGELPVEYRGEVGRLGVSSWPTSMIRLPIRKSPCTSTQIGGRGTVQFQPAKRPLECRSGVAHFVEPSAPRADLVLLGDVGGGDVGTVDRGQRRRALARAAGRGSRRRAPAGCGAGWSRLR